MKVHAIGITHMFGISFKKNPQGQKYDLTRLKVLRPVEPTGGDNFTLHGYGFEVTDLEVEATAMTKFSQVPFPCELELVIEQRLGRRGAEQIVTGFKPIAARQAA